MDKSMRTALEGQLQTKQAEAERIAAAFPHEDGKFAIPAEMHRDYVAVVREGQEIKALLEAGAQVAGIGDYLNGSDEHSEGARDAGRAFGEDNEVKSLGDMFVQSEAYQEYINSPESARRGRGVSLHASMEGKSLFTLSAGNRLPSAALGSQQDLGIAEVLRRKWHVRDLFPKSTTRANILYGLREEGWVNNAAQVKERYAADLPLPGGLGTAITRDASGRSTTDATDVFGRAPKSDLKLTPITYPVAEIAHTLDAHKNLLSDDSRLKTFINTRMIEGVKFREDYDLLHSVGDGESITGLFNTPGVQEYTGLASDKFSVQVRRAITKAELAEYDPTGIVVSPEMFEQIEVEEDAQGGFRVAVSVAIGMERKVWSLSVVKTTAMANEQFLIGAFGLGAQLHDREAVSVSASTENKDNYERGVVTFRADERVALEVPRPESFVIGTWTDYVAP